jgi:uncharacterized protein DUF2806
MNDDHLDRETSVSVELTEAGVKAKSQSRFIAAVDRLGGNLLELVNAPMERRISRERTIAASEVELIAAVTKFGIEKLNSDPVFAERVAERHFKRVFEKQQNKDAVLREALEDLRHDQTVELQAEGPLDTEFLDRLEYYSESASSEQLRQKWGRVLSAEVKTPRTFSPKVMRVVDELDAETAFMFEGFCKSVFGAVAPRCLTGVLRFNDQQRLVAAGLLTDPAGFGHVSNFSEIRSHNGSDLWTYAFNNGRSVSIPKGTSLPKFALADFTGPVQMNNAVAAIPAYLLTEVGQTISSIFPLNDAHVRYVQMLREALPNVELIEYELQPGGQCRSIATIGN